MSLVSLLPLSSLLMMDLSSQPRDEAYVRRQSDRMPIFPPNLQIHRSGQTLQIQEVARAVFVVAESEWPAGVGEVVS